MLEFQESDFMPVDRCELWWRWSRPTHTVFPVATLARIRALTPEAAEKVDGHAISLCNPKREAQDRLSAAGDPELVRAELERLPIDPQTVVVVSWDVRTAILTDWETFYRHWEAFCYPGPDDVTIMPQRDVWSLCYDHYEEFRFFS